MLRGIRSNGCETFYVVWFNIVEDESASPPPKTQREHCCFGATPLSPRSGRVGPHAAMSTRLDLLESVYEKSTILTDRSLTVRLPQFQDEEVVPLRRIPARRSSVENAESHAGGVIRYRFNAKSDRVRRADRDEGESDLRLWYGGDRRRELVEQVIGLGAYSKTLTVLSTCTPVEQEEEEDEDALEESWTPRFRR
jgi:hypothetical protein